MRPDSRHVLGVVALYGNASDRIDVAFATVFPSMTILKILCAQVAIGVLGG